MAEPDYYALMGVERGAPVSEIRASFRAKVLSEHPDKGGDPKKFQLLNKAYAVLTDSEKRRAYDATGRAEKSAEEDFLDGFGGGRLRSEQRPKDADDMAVISLQDRIAAGPDSHEDGFAAWMRQRDQDAMVLSDKDFMKSHLFNAQELAAKIEHPTPVQHVLGSPRLDEHGQPAGGPVQVQSRPRPLQKNISHDQVLVRMSAVPVDDAMIYADLRRADVCLGGVGVGRVEQAGARVELKAGDTVLVLPKPAKFSTDRPIGTARTLLPCNEEDVIRVPDEIVEELTPEQMCLTPTIVQAYELLEQYGRKCKPGDSVLLNAAHLFASGSALLQLCKLLKLKPLCLLALPGAPKNLAKGEFGTDSAWKDAERQTAPASVRAQFERISEFLVNMGAEEVFPDAMSLLRWRDGNQRLLPKLALDGIASRESCEQLIHCLQSGDKDAQLVVYGHGMAQPLDISPPLLAAWGGRVYGFNISRWVHSLNANAKKMMSVMENLTKLIRANKFQIDTCLCKIGEDSVSDAFARATDPVENVQVVLTFPSLEEEHSTFTEKERAEQERLALKKEQDARRRKEREEREKVTTEWLDLLFTEQSVAAKNPEDPLSISQQVGNKSSPNVLVVWVGDEPTKDDPVIKELPSWAGSAAVVVSVAWPEHPAAEAYREFDLEAAEVTDGSWYQRDKATLENTDLDLLSDVELLGRSLVETVNPHVEKHGLDWNRVVFMGFGKGAGIALYATLMKLVPKPPCSLALFSPVVLFPAYLGKKMATLPKQRGTIKVFTIWGNHNRSTPANYRHLLAQTMRQMQDVHCTPDTMPDGGNEFDERYFHVITSILPLCMPR